MKKTFVTLLSFLLPLFALAAVVDVSGEPTLILPSTGDSYNFLSDTGVGQITINNDNFSFEITGGQVIKISSPDRRPLDNNQSASVACGDDKSEVIIELDSSKSTTTVTVTPGSGTCGTAGTTSSGSSNSSGSGPAPGTVTTIKAPEIIVKELPDVSKTPAAEVAKPSPVAQLVSPVFNSALRLGNRSADIKRLQQLLNSDPDTKLTDSGLGSPGNETDFFGALTRAAVKAFQVKYGIVSSGDEATTGYGLVGPKTRAKLAEVFSQVKQVAAPESAVLEVETLQSQINVLLEKVKALQEQLKVLQP